MSSQILVMPLLYEENGYFYLSFNISQGQVTSLFEVESPQSVSCGEWESFLAHLRSKDYKQQQSLDFSKTGGGLEIVTYNGIVELIAQKYNKSGVGSVNTSIPVADFIEPLYVAIQMLKNACIWANKTEALCSINNTSNNTSLTSNSTETVYLVVPKQQSLDISVFDSHEDAKWFISPDSPRSSLGYIIIPRVVIRL